MKAERVDLAQSDYLSSIVRAYLNNDNDIRDLHQGLPSRELFDKVISARDFSESDRRTLVKVLRQQNSSIDLSSQTLKHIDDLGEGSTFAVTTGHQLCLATGPLYVICKAISAILLSRQLNEWFEGKKFVPVFWLASEDHDLDEINHVRIGGANVVWNGPQAGSVGRMNTDGINALWENAFRGIQDSPLKEKAMSMLHGAYASGTLSEAMRAILNNLLGEYGLVILDGDDKSLKELAVPVFEREILNQVAAPEVNKASEALRAHGFKPQVSPREINMFYLEPNSRRRIVLSGDGGFGVLDTSLRWSRDEMLAELKARPESFSPNVIMRPVYQECILPGVAYVGGPGELAYWLQLKGVFETFSVPMPLMVLRDHVMVIDSRTAGRLSKLELSSDDLIRDSEEIIRHWIADHSEGQLNQEKQAMSRIFDDLAEKAAIIDPTLEKSVRAEEQRQLNAIDNLGKKISKALKSREELRIQQLKQIFSVVYPDGIPQERSVNYFDLSLSNGQWLIPLFMSSLDPLDTRLKVIYADPVFSASSDKSAE